MSSSQDKNLPATAHRLKKAREEGQLPRSKELSNLAVLGGGAVLLMLLLPLGFAHLQTALASQLRFDHTALLQPQLLTERLHASLGLGLTVFLPLGVAVLALAVFAAFASGSWTLTTHTMKPDLGKLSPIAGLGRLFSKQQLFETTKLAVMTAIVGFVGWKFLSSHIAGFASLLMQPLEGGLGQLALWMRTGVGILLGVVTLFALIDFPMQKFLHAQRLRMSREEVKQEHKQNEGDPHVKGQRRRRQRELAHRISIGAVPRADLVVMNPTHYAVAIQYDDATMAAPRVIAKGADLLALRIRDVAKEHKVPVLQSPMLARALYAHAELDQEIPSALYTAVAQVLAYVYQLKAALAGRGAMPGAAPNPQVPPELDPHWKQPPTRGAAE
ncbi:EscU/YscU/HrcU family type III secretion system export apparatus switch protein [Hydrogenophaga pseudoflava]|uniref:EscU/YscU/HrcU family type III secretion system export apparatus switch protein n=1 Tax=Hydrogenophaga pseudoflava TaxID=47421 RepID=UPI0027E48E99|nr:flagellar type III secretion system protein FlhB [Hydrogenophaga pseudoflava]MDQ7743588.1 flagellar type III secretion system protein FlhB [Hydrogenophaga pseudoflava]